MGILQDQIVDLIYDIFPNIVFHGGTSIWRCYSGNRFSEDLDFYLLEQENIKELIIAEIKKRNLILIKYKQTDNLVFTKISFNEVIVQLEIRVLKEDNVTKLSLPIEYKKIDGSTSTVLCLTNKALLFEKALAFRNRKLIRDIYDVYFLSNFVKLDLEETNNLKQIISEFTTPIDEPNLKSIVYRGFIPSYTQMLDFIKNKY